MGPDTPPPAPSFLSYLENEWLDPKAVLLLLAGWGLTSPVLLLLRLGVLPTGATPWVVAGYILLTLSYIAAAIGLKVPSKPETENHWLVGLWFVGLIGWLPLTLMFVVGMLCQPDASQRLWLDPVTIALIDICALMIWGSGTEFVEPMGGDPKEMVSLIPPLYLVGTILLLLLAYNGTHLLKGVDWSVEQSLPAPLRVVYWLLLALWVTCYVRVLLTPPGGLADCGGEPKTRVAEKVWSTCTICSHKKPQRCRHCTKCQTCVLKMDHHCPWLRQCIGYRNYKYFFLLVFYATALLIFIAATLLPFVIKLRIYSVPPPPFWTKALLGFPAAMVLMLSILLTGFLGFHTFLAWKAMTTIEFLQYYNKGATYNFNQGAYRNFQAILGSNPLLWFLPLSPPEGDGSTFPYVVWQGTEGRGAHVILAEGQLINHRSAMDMVWVEEKSAPTCIGDMYDHCIEVGTAGAQEEDTDEEDAPMFDEGI